MMRWLKEKKRGEKKAGYHGGAYDDSAYRDEDDYGFEKEKPPNKSPVTKRQLPPTPAAPEEKSTHIYEEIPDLHVSCLPEPERVSLLLKAKNNKHGGGNKSKTSSGANNNVSNGNKNNGNKNNSSSNTGGGSSAVEAAGSASLDDSISPYMVVPVDEEVRQTPPHFHRNGTPEVHCDLIVKDTHCEVLLTRKPKIGAFRLDSAALNGGEKGLGGGGGGGGGAAGSSASSASGIRNNTHFCSWNRRASVDVQAGGGGGEGNKGASAFSWSSSAFSSASTSRVNSVGTSSMSLTALPEHHRHQGHGHHHHPSQVPPVLAEGEGGASNGSSTQGVMTYSTASNFIPRSTKLVFKPLTPLDPELFDDADQDLALRAAELACQVPVPGSAGPTTAIHGPTVPGDSDGSIEYTSVLQGQPNTASDSPVVYSAIQNDEFYDGGGGGGKPIPIPQQSQQQQQHHGYGQCQPSSPPSLQEIRACQISDGVPFRSSALIRPYSPSSSSSCTYASVSFPPESRVYNTIQDLDSLIESSPGHLVVPGTSLPGPRDGNPSVYPGAAGVIVGGGDAACNDGASQRQAVFASYGGVPTADFATDDSRYPGSLPGPQRTADAAHHLRPSNFALQHQQQQQQQQHQHSDGSVMDNSKRPELACLRVGPIPDGPIYSGIVSPSDFSDETTYACIDAKEEGGEDNDVNEGLATHTTSSLLKNKMDGGLLLDLGFCTCHDYQQYSSCGCSGDLKGDDDDDDAASIATTTTNNNNEPKASCSGCGRLIRQITYSESYSDETYEHAYSSRLLLRKGRRFSSPDITVSEISNSESQDLRFRQSSSPFGSMSRDDMSMWSRYQPGDVLSTFYRPDGDLDSASLEPQQKQQQQELQHQQLLLQKQQHPPVEQHAVVLNGRDPRPELSSSRKNEHQPARGHRKSFCAFTNSASELDILLPKPLGPGGKPPLLQQLKRTSLPVNALSPCASAVLPPPATPDHGRSARSSAVAQLQPKSSAFSGLFSKFTRPKASKAATKASGDEDTENGLQSVKSSSQGHQRSADALPANNKQSSSAAGAIPEKNTLKLSKLFQRISAKETTTTTNTTTINGCEPSSTHAQTHHHAWDWNSESGLWVDLEDSGNSKSHKPIQPDPQKDQCPPNQYTTTPTSNKISHRSDFSLDINKNFTNTNTTTTATAFNKNNSNNNNDNNINDNNINSSSVSAGTSNKNTNNANVKNGALSDIDDASVKSNLVLKDATPELKSGRHRTTLSGNNSTTVHSIAPSSDQANNNNNNNPSSCFSPSSVQQQETGAAKGKASTSKTDSGDTCYEYDISTSSESEHTNYDYFLSKVKKSLNLEKEVQHIADMNALRRRLLCKLCKKGTATATSSSSDHCEMLGVDGVGGATAACTHVKCLDWRKLFGELVVVDQRAAILDCLTDFTHSPYTVKGDGLLSSSENSNQCRECGGEIMTSDSESLTTVYSLLSQHLQVTSTGGARTPSCDSDEGTMADNSCESADDDDNYDDEKNDNGGDSSGFDDYDEFSGHNNPRSGDPQQRNGGSLKSKRREKSGKDKKDRKGNSHHSHLDRSRRRSHASITNEGAVDQIYKKGESSVGAPLSSLGSVADNHPSSPHHHHHHHHKHASSKRSSTVGVQRQNSGSNNNGCHQPFPSSSSSSSIMAARGRSSSVENVAQNQKSPVKDGPVGSGADSSKTSGAKTSILATDKAIQDIYARLPSKALSWLTARHMAPRTSNTCACGSSRVSPSASTGSLQKIGVVETPSLLTTSKRKEKEGFGLDLEEKQKESSGLTTTTTHQGEKPFASNSNADISSGNSDKPLLLVSRAENNNNKNNNNNNDNNNTSSPNDPHPEHQAVTSHSKKSVPDPARKETRPKNKMASGEPETSQASPSNSGSSHQEPKPSPTLNRNLARRRARQLPLAALDLLPETAFGSDVVVSGEESKGLQPERNASEPSAPKDTDVVSSSPSTPAAKAPRPRLVERMARLFESNCNNSSNNSKSSNAIDFNARSNTGDLTTALAGAAKSEPKAHSSKIRSSFTEKKMGDFKVAPFDSKGDNERDDAFTSRHHGATTEGKDKANACTQNGRRFNHSRSLSSSDAHQVQAPKPQTAEQIPASGKSDTPIQTETSKRGSTHSSHDRLDNTRPNSKRSNSTSGTESKLARNRDAPNRLATPPSPTCSSSSSSSSSSSLSRRRGGGQPKQKRLSKKSHLNKKIKSKVAERKKKKKKDGGGKEEKTYYCFSSDISDIDVMEVEDWDTYTTNTTSTSTSTTTQPRAVSESRRRSYSNGRGHHVNNNNNNNNGLSQHGATSSHHQQHHHHHGSKDHKQRRDRSASRSRDVTSGGKRQHRSTADDGTKGASPSSAGSQREVPNKDKTKGRVCLEDKEEGSGGGGGDELVQEIYAMPPNSSEVCEVKGHRREDSAPSPNASPELQKWRQQSKRTDVIYKTKKSNNRLLSDMIIRNYDRQVFGNV